MMFDDLLARLNRWLSENRADYFSKLQSGVEPNAFHEFERQFSLQLPKEFRLLYAWRNGQPTYEFESFQDNRMFSSIRDVADTKEMLDGMIGYDFDDPKWWRSSWVPFLSNGGGDHLCVDLSAEDGGEPGQLIEFWHDDSDRNVAYSSLTEWLKDLVESMENGTFQTV